MKLSKTQKEILVRDGFVKLPASSQATWSMPPCEPSTRHWAVRVSIQHDW